MSENQPDENPKPVKAKKQKSRKSKVKALTGRRRRGAPTTLTPEIIKEIEKHLRVGNYQNCAATFAGVPRPTLYHWIKLAHEAPETHPLHVELLDTISRAQSYAEKQAVARLLAAGKDDWRATAWFLERRFYNNWGQRSKLELTGHDGGPIETQTKVTHEVDLTKLSNEELEALERLIEKAQTPKLVGGPSDTET